MEEIEKLVADLAVIKTRQKQLAEHEASIKEDLLSLMKERGLENEATDYGTIRIQRRSEKDYGENIRNAEIALKEDKKLADDMGDYKILNVKESIVFILPKDIF